MRIRGGCERGAAAVEAAIVVSVLLVPLLIGVIQWGEYFWRAQRVDTLAPRVPEGEIAGFFDCDGLKDRVATAVVDVANGLDPEADPIDVSDVAVEVVEVLPEVGVIVQIHVEVQASGLASLIPLPGGGALVTDFTQRLDDVTVSDVTCR